MEYYSTLHFMYHIECIIKLFLIKQTYSIPLLVLLGLTLYKIFWTERENFFLSHSTYSFVLRFYEVKVILCGFSILVYITHFEVSQDPTLFFFLASVKSPLIYLKLCWNIIHFFNTLIKIRELILLRKTNTSSYINKNSLRVFS